MEAIKRHLSNRWLLIFGGTCFSIGFFVGIAVAAIIAWLV
jgi:hypothetical protein